MSKIHIGNCTKVLEELLHKHEWGTYKFFEAMQKLVIEFKLTEDDVYTNLLNSPFCSWSCEEVCNRIINTYTDLPVYLIDALHELHRKIHIGYIQKENDRKHDPFMNYMHRLFEYKIDSVCFREAILGMARILGYADSPSENDTIHEGVKALFWDYKQDTDNLELLERLVYSIASRIRCRKSAKDLDDSDKLLYLYGRLQEYRSEINNDAKIKEESTMSDQKKCPKCPGECPDKNEVKKSKCVAKAKLRDESAVNVATEVGKIAGETVKQFVPDETAENVTMQKFETFGNPSTSVLLDSVGNVNIGLLRDLVDGDQFTSYCTSIESMVKMWRKFTPAMYKKTLLYMLDRFYIPHEKCHCGGSENMLKIGNGIFNHSCLCVNVDWLDGPYIKLKTQHGSPASFTITNGDIMEALPYIADVAMLNANMKYCKATDCSLVPIIFAIDRPLAVREENGREYGIEDHTFFFGVADKVRVEELGTIVPVICRAFNVPKLKIEEITGTKVPVVIIDDSNQDVREEIVIAIANTVCGGDKPNPVPYFVEFMQVFTNYLQRRDECVDYANDVDRDPV